MPAASHSACQLLGTPLDLAISASLVGSARRPTSKHRYWTSPREDFTSPHRCSSNLWYPPRWQSL